MRVQELIRIENRGRGSELYAAGLNLSKGIYGLAFDQLGNNSKNPKLTITIDIKEFLQGLSEITPEQLEAAKKTIAPYLVGYARTATEGGGSSMQVLR